MGKFLTYIGNAAARLLTHLDLAGLGADAKELEQLGENKAIAFIRGVATHVEADLARFIADHPTLSAEFHVLSDDEAAAEVAHRTGNSSDSSTPTTSSSTSDSSASDGDNDSNSSNTSSAPTIQNSDPSEQEASQA